MHTRGRGSDGGRSRRGELDELEAEEQQRRGGRDASHRRVDPVMREANKRGLDVEALHDSATPAWGNLRGRNSRGRKTQSYYEGPEEEEEEEEDEVADPRSEEEEEEEDSEQADSSEEEDEEADEVEEERGQAPRTSKRVRQQVQRYNPRPEDGQAASGPRRRTKHRQPDYREPDSSSGEEDGGRRRARRGSGGGGGTIEDVVSGEVLRHTEAFTQRYSARERRTVERFNPLTYGGSQQGPPGGSGGGASGGSRKRRRDRGGASGSSSEGGSSSEEEEEEEEEDRREEQEQAVRRQYSFRDRALVTINPHLTLPSSQQQQLGSQPPYGGGSQHDRKRPRSDHRSRHGGGGGSRLRRAGSRRAADWEDEMPDLDLPAAYHALAPPPAALVPYAGAVSGGAGASHQGQPQPQQPWELAVAGRGPGGAPAWGQAGSSKGSGNAEITPLQVDPSLTFQEVGGLDHYIKALKEMIFLPLVYPELFERFHISPPRGVLFYGPPGTGKTLVARALAAHAARGAGRKVSFFMRKGADVLSKWVGEAERQLRLLFEEAQRHQPSIIFFDEIDGLAPVRSSKQDQIHNSIVSTLLALMDGLDARGQVVVIGATNRVDALDGALRRPGRFDRELVFPLPSLSARGDILRIHTSKWAQPPPKELLEELAQLCVGYCGADLKALCTEASLQSLRRHYPQIYEADQKLLLDPGRVRVESRDFLAALRTITPASHRSAVTHARPLPPLVLPLLGPQLQGLLGQLQASFPPAAACLRNGFGGGNAAASFSGRGDEGGELFGDEDELLPEDGTAAGGSSSSSTGRFWGSAAALGVQRPRLLLCGVEGAGQSHLGPAVLYALEGLPVHAIGLPSLLSDVGARSPEEALVHALVEARRAAPAVLYLPHLQVWWDTAPASLRATLWMLLADLPPDLPLLLLATADVPSAELDPECRQLFGSLGGGIFELAAPQEEQRAEFFQEVAAALALPPRPPVERRQVAEPPAPLPRAPEAIAAEEEARKQAEERAARQKYEADQAALRALRMLLRGQLLRLLANRKWEGFASPPSPKEDPLYWERVSQPMDLGTLLARVDARLYLTPQQFLADVALIPQGEREYWGDDTQGVREISRACALEDDLRQALAAAVPAELQAQLEAIVAAGGPAPAPPSLQQLAAPPVTLAPEGPAAGLLAGGGAARRVAAAAAASGAEETRRATRHAGSAVDDWLLHTDPEAAARRIRLLKKVEQAAAAGGWQAAAGAPAEGAPAAAADAETEADAAGEAGEQQEQGKHLEAEREEAAEAAEAEAGSDDGADMREVLAASTRENLPEAGAAEDAMASAAAGKLLQPKCTGGDVQQQQEGGHISSAPAEAAAHDATAEQQQATGDAQQQQQVAEDATEVAATAAARAAYRPSEADWARATALKQQLGRHTRGLAVEALEALHARLVRLAADNKQTRDRDAAVAEALQAVAQWMDARLTSHPLL